MENTKQKIDILHIDDKLNLPINELLKRAEFIASEEAISYGWSSVSVSYSGARPEQNGEYLRYSFDVFGLSEEGVNTSSEQQLDLKTVSEPKAAAAPDAEI